MITKESGAYAPDIFDGAEIAEDEQAMRAAAQLGELVDTLLRTSSGDIYREGDNEHLTMEKIIDMNNYLSVFVRSGVLPDINSDSPGQAVKSVTLVKTRGGRADGAVVYELTNDRATRRYEEEDDNGTSTQEAQPLTLDDIRDLERLFGIDAVKD